MAPTFVRTQTIDHVIGQDGRLTLRVTSGDVAVHGGSGDEVRVRANYEIRAGTEDEANRVFIHAMHLTAVSAGVVALAGAIALTLAFRAPRRVRDRVEPVAAAV